MLRRQVSENMTSQIERPARPRRVLFRRYGAPSVLEIERFAPLRAGAGEVVVRVAFAGINYADVLARRGLYQWAPPPPTCVGFEVSGTVVEVGSGVQTLAVGDRVLAVTRFGGYADEVVVAEDRLWKLPASMSLAEGAAFPAVYLTAWHSLVEVARVRAGESVLVQAVAGGVGLAALQIAKALGLRTFGTASSDAKLEVAKEHGLDEAINYARDDFERVVMERTGGRGVDVVLDSLGGAALKKGYRCLAPSGKLVTIGAAQVAPAKRTPVSYLKAGVELARGGLFHPFQLITDNRAIAGVQILLLWDELALFRREMAELFALYEQGALRPVIDSTVTFERAAEAHARLESRASRGKLLLSTEE